MMAIKIPELQFQKGTVFLKIENNSRWQCMESALQGDNHYCYKMSGNKCGSI